MAVFSYKAIDRNGSIIKGTAEGIDPDLVYSSIEATGLTVLGIKKTNDYFARISEKLASRKVTRKDIIEFANNLSLMLKAGMPLLMSLSDIADSTENKFFRQTVNNIQRTVEYGSKFSEAIAANKDVFPDIFIRIIMIGEETGSLDKSLADIASHLQKIEDLSSAIKRALIYPIFTIITTIGALIFWLAYVLPKVLGIFKEMNLKLPFFTRVLLHVSGFTQAYWYILVALPAVVFISIKLLKQKKETLYYIDMSKIKFPVMKHIVYNKLLALFSEQLRILTVAGIPVNRSFEIVSEMIGNEVFRVAIKDIAQGIASGSTISDSLKKHKVFSPMVARVIQIGETSGTLDEQFEYLSTYYLKKLDDVSERLGKMIEPIVITVLGMMFAFIMAGLLFPIYELITRIGTQ